MTHPKIFGIDPTPTSDGTLRAIRFPFRGQVGKIEGDPYRWRWVLVLHPWEIRVEEGICQSGVQAIVAMEARARHIVREMQWFLVEPLKGWDEPRVVMVADLTSSEPSGLAGEELW